MSIPRTAPKFARGAAETAQPRKGPNTGGPIPRPYVPGIKSRGVGNSAVDAVPVGRGRGRPGPVTRADYRMIARDNTVLEQGLRPRPAPHGDGFATAFHYAPGRSHTLLGGDFCDVVQTADGTVHAVMGDVSGHGAAEAALGVHLRLAWRAAVLCGQGPRDQLRLLERILVQERPKEDTFATVLSLVLRPHLGSYRMISAGHPGLLHRHRRTVRWVDPQPGIPLGLFPGLDDWHESEMALSDRDGLVLVTDGLYEGRTACGRLGEQGLLGLAARYASLPSQTFVDALVRHVSLLAAPFGGLADDVTVLHLACDRRIRQDGARTTG